MRKQPCQYRKDAMFDQVNNYQLRFDKRSDKSGAAYRRYRVGRSE